MKLQIVSTQTYKELQRFDLVSAIRNNSKCNVGRSATSNLIIKDPDISRSHGEFSYKSGRYYFTDTGSSNGSLVNNEIAIKNHPYLLKAGDIIRLGDYLLIPQPIVGVDEDATIIASKTSISLANTSKPSGSKISDETKIIRKPNWSSVDKSASEELLKPTVARSKNDVNKSPSPEFDEDIPAKVTDIEESTPPEAVAENDTTELSHGQDSMADATIDENIPAPVKQAEETTILQESIPETMTDSKIADPIAATTDKPNLSEEYHPDATVAQEMVENNSIALAEKAVPTEEALVSTVEESADSSVPVADTSTENMKVEEAQLTEIGFAEASGVEFVNKTPPNEIASTTATPEETNKPIKISPIPKILQEKYIVLLADDSQKVELVDFIKAHRATFSKCLLMASRSVNEVLEENDIFVHRELSNLTNGGYQEVNSEIVSNNLFGVIFLRDFVQQSSSVEDEALCRECNINQVILATNIATARAVEGYLQYLIVSTPKASLTKG